MLGGVNEPTTQQKVIISVRYLQINENNVSPPFMACSPAFKFLQISSRLMPLLFLDSSFFFCRGKTDICLLTGFKLHYSGRGQPSLVLDFFIMPEVSDSRGLWI